MNIKERTGTLFLIAILSAFAAWTARAAESQLPGTGILDWTGDLSLRMHETAHRDIERMIDRAPTERLKFWRRDVSGPEAYERSIETNRTLFKKRIGLVDARARVTMERLAEGADAVISETPAYRVFSVRWKVLDNLDAEGLLLEPKNEARGAVVAIPDADQSPEQICGLADGIEVGSQFGRRFAELGFVVLVPVLVDRTDRWSGHPEFWMTNMPHREWIHRQAYMMGRHIIGYEVQKVLAGVDWLRQGNHSWIGVAGYGEGGLIGFYAAACDPRIDAVLVSGYFRSRQKTWEEPLYRNVWGLLREFGDAEIASLVAPRSLVVEHGAYPNVANVPAPPPGGRKRCAAPGHLSAPTKQEVEAEFARIASLTPDSLQKRTLIEAEGFGSEKALEAFTKGCPKAAPPAPPTTAPRDKRKIFDVDSQQKRTVEQLENCIQELVRDSARIRNEQFLFRLMPEFQNEPWNMKLDFPTYPPERFARGAVEYRTEFRDEVIGRVENSLPPPNARTRKLYDEPGWTGYEVVLDVGPFDGFAWGILCVPKGLKEGERRPVVVCQHGRNGVPSQAVEGNTDYYHNFASRLAARGYVTFAPHNLYRNEALYRMLSRKANTIHLSMFSLIVRHHEQLLNWMETLPFVDKSRIGFYGLSYGGESAMRIPAILDRYALSICSGDFNDWTRKVASTHDRFSFMFTDEWEMPYFNMGASFNYAELSYLIFPRPFMVERGHHDGVGLDEWVASEYAKTKRFYVQFGLGDRTGIEFFNGGHTIFGRGTFDFLDKHLGR